MTNRIEEDLQEQVERETPQEQPPTTITEGSILDVARALKIEGLQEGINKCCFHDDKNPSLSIFDNGKAFKCHGCDKKGGVVQFVMAYKNCSWNDAQKFLAHKKLKVKVSPNIHEQTKRALLQRGRPEFKQLKFGIHNGFFYYGTTIYTDKNTPLSAIITSNRELLVNGLNDKNEIQEAGINFHNDFEASVLDREGAHIQTEALYDFIEGREALPLKELYKKIVELNKRYMWYNNTITHKFIACDIISTYFLPFFDAKGRTVFVSDKGSGKTTQGRIYSLLSHNALMSPDTSPSSFFRLMEGTTTTLVIDDFDDVPEELRQTIMRLFKTGYKKGGVVLRTGEAGKKGKRAQEPYNPYGHIVLNNTKGLDHIALDRCVQIPITKAPKSAKLKDFDIESTEWQELVNELTLAGLTYWKDVQKTAHSIETSLHGRKREVCLAVLTIAELVGCKEELEEWLSNILVNEDYDDPNDDYLYKTVEYYAKQRKGYSAQPKEIAEFIHGLPPSTEWGKRQYDKDIRVTARIIGSKLRNLAGIFRHKRVKGINNYEYLSPVKLQEYAHTMGWEHLEFTDLETHKGIRAFSNEPDLTDQLLAEIRSEPKGLMNVEKVIQFCENNGLNFDKLLQEGILYQPKNDKVGVL